MTDAELDRRLTEPSRDDSRRFDAVAKLMAQFAERIDARFESLNARLDILENQYRRIEARLDGMKLQMRAFHKAPGDHERTIMGILATQAAQQRAMDSIVGRLQRLENPPRPQ